MENAIVISEVQNATTTEYGLTSDGWDLLNGAFMVGVFIAVLGIFLSAVFIGIHLSRK